MIRTLRFLLIHRARHSTIIGKGCGGLGNDLVWFPGVASDAFFQSGLITVNSIFVLASS
jgi:hypothetical protein